MVKITKRKVTDSDGNVRRVKTIEAQHVRIEHTDGRVEEYGECIATEQLYRPEGRFAEWFLRGIPGTVIPRQMRNHTIKAITLLSENSTVLLKLIEITVVVFLSTSEDAVLRGVEKEELSNEALG